MKKILIYFPERKLAPKGGPAGYLCNLKKGLQLCEHEDLNIEFYKNSPVEIEENIHLRNTMPRRLKELRRAYKFANYLKKELPIDESMFKYDVIHFHKTEDMYLNRKFLEEYKGKVILTSHTPCVPYQEIIGRLNPKDYSWFKRKIDNLVEMDKYAFERADYIIFPCKDAEEPYYNTWKEYKDIRDSSKYFYMPTGIEKCKARIDKKTFRERHGIPKDAFVISYVGRHNEIKGYGDLKKIGEKLLQNREIYFLIGGKEEPMKGIKDSHWIEIGWTTDPHSLIAASDVFLLPNHETYFDLILLEVISLGIPVIMSKTGGNKYFQKFGEKGLAFYSNLDEAYENVLKFKKNDIKDKQTIEKSLEQLFDQEFTIEKFASNYSKQIRNILEK